MYVCVRERKRECVREKECVCVCVRERESESESEREREREEEREREREEAQREEKQKKLKKSPGLSPLECCRDVLCECDVGQRDRIVAKARTFRSGRGENNPPTPWGDIIQGS